MKKDYPYFDIFCIHDQSQSYYGDYTWSFTIFVGPREVHLSANREYSTPEAADKAAKRVLSKLKNP